MFGGSGGRILLEPWHIGLAALALILAIGEEKWEWFERAIWTPMRIHASVPAVMLFGPEIFDVLDLPVLAADVGRRLHHGKQQTNHHENCQSRCDDHKRLPIPTHR
jgi:hypothetical protein